MVVDVVAFAAGAGVLPVAVVIAPSFAVRVVPPGGTGAEVDALVGLAALLDAALPGVSRRRSTRPTRSTMSTMSTPSSRSSSTGRRRARALAVVGGPSLAGVAPCCCAWPPPTRWLHSHQSRPIAQPRVGAGGRNSSSWTAALTSVVPRRQVARRRRGGAGEELVEVDRRCEHELRRRGRREPAAASAATAESVGANVFMDTAFLRGGVRARARRPTDPRPGGLRCGVR